MIHKQLKSVLLVDDDKITNFINERLIVKLNISQVVKVLTNGKEAIDYIRELSENNESFPSLILLDINMPVMDGFEFIDCFKEIETPNKVSIVMLTTSSNQSDLDKISKTPQITGYINKPLTEQKIEDVMQKYI